MATKPRGNPWAKHCVAAYRSGLEVAISAAFVAAGVTAAYEALKVPYTRPASNHTYSPDWILENGIVVEGKGRFMADDRAKHLLIKAQHPGLDVRFIFTNPRAPISKGSKTTYATWCEKHGYKYAKKECPTEWMHEPVNESSLAALAALGWRP